MMIALVPPQAMPPSDRAMTSCYVAYPPWRGPLVVWDGDRPRRIGLGSDPLLGRPRFVWLRPVRPTATGWEYDNAPLGNPKQVHPAGSIQIEALRPDQTWYPLELPAWAQRPNAPLQYLVVLMIYAQGEQMRGDGPGSGWGSRWPQLKHLLEIGESPATPLDPDHGPMIQAVRKAIKNLPIPPQPNNKIGAPQSQAPDIPAPGIIDCRRWHRPLDSRVSIALGACQYAPGLLDTQLAYRAWKDLALAVGAGDFDLMLLAGDQVYVDASAGLFDPSVMEDRYDRPYEKWLGASEVKQLLRALPVATLLDDHELDDCWEPMHLASGDVHERARRRNRRNRDEGVAAFRHYQRCEIQGVRPIDPPLWQILTLGPVSAFLANTRSERDLRFAAPPPSRNRASRLQEASIMSEDQHEQLETWLKDQELNKGPRLLVSPGLLLPRLRVAAPATLLGSSGEETAPHGALSSDAWTGYPDSLHRVLGEIYRHKVRNLVLLSGDEHIGLLSDISLRKAADPEDPNAVSMAAVHTPGLYAPFRFANAHPADFPLAESFEFDTDDGSGQALRLACSVTTLPPFAGRGFTHIALENHQGGSWTLRATLGLGADQTATVQRRWNLAPNGTAGWIPDLTIDQ